MKHIRLLFIIFQLPYVFAQQVTDSTFRPALINPAYKVNQGPIVYIDAGHHNFHTKEGRYKPFATLLERDGYQVKSYEGKFNLSQLSKGKILVIANALSAKNVTDWTLPTPSAFSEDEILVVKKWIENGGSLFLLADHMPMAGAAKDLAKIFDFEFTNGFAFDSVQQGPTTFNRQQGMLHINSITKGRNDTEKITEVLSFTGQAFKIPDTAQPILSFDARFINLIPDTAWVFTPQTTRHNLNGWSQGAYRRFGKGNVVVFGEAGMFSAQLVGSSNYKAGMNNDAASQNFQLLLNIIHYLDELIDE
ncbi:GldG family protein [Flavobacteriaceae bacterium F08102]|nr:GldG family protein [Flavobacteriaceae bacterium F08102]